VTLTNAPRSTGVLAVGKVTVISVWLAVTGSPFQVGNTDLSS
jgi:hypothetical protein